MADTENPPQVFGNAAEVQARPFRGSEAVTVKILLPDDFRFDMALNVAQYASGAGMPFVETHVMEHGVLFLEGDGNAAARGKSRMRPGVETRRGSLPIVLTISRRAGRRLPTFTTKTSIVRCDALASHRRRRICRPRPWRTASKRELERHRLGAIEGVRR